MKLCGNCKSYIPDKKYGGMVGNCRLNGEVVCVEDGADCEYHKEGHIDLEKVEKYEQIAKEFLQTENICKKVVPKINGWFFWEPIRGGKSLMIDGFGNKLGAKSSVGFDRHLEEFEKRFGIIREFTVKWEDAALHTSVPMTEDEAAEVYAAIRPGNGIKKVELHKAGERIEVKER